MLARKPLIILSMIAIAIWLAVVPIRLVGRQCLKEYRLWKHGVQSTAVITALDPDNHQTVHYSYHAHSSVLNGSGRAGFGNPAFNQLKVGQELSAIYLSFDPSISCLGSPRLLLMNDVIPFSLFLVVVIALIGYQCRKYLKA